MFNLFLICDCCLVFFHFGCVDSLCLSQCGCPTLFLFVISDIAEKKPALGIKALSGIYTIGIDTDDAGCCKVT